MPPYSAAEQLLAYVLLVTAVVITLVPDAAAIPTTDTGIGSVLSSTYFGGSENDVISAVAVSHDGLYLIGGYSSSTDALLGMQLSHPASSVATYRLASGDGFVARARTAPFPALETLARLAGVRHLAVVTDGSVLVAGMRSVSLLAPNLATLTWSRSLDGSVRALAYLPDGEGAEGAGRVLLVTDASLISLNEATGALTWQAELGGSGMRVQGLAVAPTSHHVFVSGAVMRQTAEELAYATPFIKRFSLNGDALSTLYEWPSSSVEAQAPPLVADSSIGPLAVDPHTEDLWWIGHSAGEITVLQRSSSNLSANEEAFTGSCFPTPCSLPVDYEATLVPSLVQALLSDTGPGISLSRASFLWPKGVVNDSSDAACGCPLAGGGSSLASPPWAHALGVAAMRLGATGEPLVAVFGRGGQVVTETSNAWYPSEGWPVVGVAAWGDAAGVLVDWDVEASAWVDGDAGLTQGYLVVMDTEMTQVLMATALPGTMAVTSAIATDDGKLVLAGYAADPRAVFGYGLASMPCTPWVPETANTTSDMAPPGAIQSSYGGGQLDGFLLTVCLRADGCVGDLPPVTGRLCDAGCSGRGSCGPLGECVCDTGYQGQDCSLLTCPVPDRPVWEAILPPAPLARSGHVASSLYGDMVVFGGVTSGGVDPATGDIIDVVMGDVQVLRRETATWQRVHEYTPAAPEATRGPAPRHGHAATQGPSVGQVWVHGGIGADGALLGDLWLMRAAEGSSMVTWAQASVTGAVPPPAYGHSLTSLQGGGVVVLFAGCNEVTASRDGYLLNTASLRWTMMAASMGARPAARCHHTAVAVTVPSLGECVLVFGGSNQLRLEVLGDLWRWCLSTGSWSLMEPFDRLLPRPVPRYGHAAASVNHRLVVFGGFTSFQFLDFLNDLWQWDDVLRLWVHVTPTGLPPLPRLFHTLTLVTCDLVVYGGSTLQTGAPLDELRATDYQGLLCEAGSYLDSELECLPCEPGTFAATKGSYECQPCPPGTFDYAGAATACAPCPAGYASAAVGATTLGYCISCAAGSFSAEGAAGCSVCPPGTYSEDSAAAECTPCEAGYFSTSAGASSSSTCQQVPPGTYSTLGSVLPIPCPSGTFSPDPGATACSDCPQGTYSGQRSSECQPCPPGTLSLQSRATSPSACAPCPTGTYSSSYAANACTPCGLGTASAALGASSPSACAACAAGSIAPRRGMAACEACPAGTFTSLTGQVACSPCPRGTYLPATGSASITACVACPAGTFTRDPGTPEVGGCQQCSPGWWLDQSALTCVPCGAGTYLDAAALLAGPATSPSACLPCPVGQFSPAGASACTPCEASTFGFAGWSACAACDATCTHMPRSLAGATPASGCDIAGTSSCSQGVCLCRAGSAGADCGLNLTSAASVLEFSRALFLVSDQVLWLPSSGPSSIVLSNASAANVTLFRKGGLGVAARVNLVVTRAKSRGQRGGGGGGGAGLSQLTSATLQLTFPAGQASVELILGVANAGVDVAACDEWDLAIASPSVVPPAGGHQVSLGAVASVSLQRFTEGAAEASGSAGDEGGTLAVPGAYSVTLNSSATLARDLSFRMPADSGDPLDVLLLTDASASFRDDLAFLRSSVALLLATLQAEYPGSRLGLATFIDQPTPPFGASGDYEYLLAQPVAGSAPVLQATADQLTAGHGGDSRQSQLTALLRVAQGAEQAFNRSELGDSSERRRRVVLLSTDSEFHEAGDGAGEGGHPTITAVKEALLLANISPLFAVTARARGAYDTLVQQLGFGDVQTLAADSSNLARVLSDGLIELQRSVQLMVAWDPLRLVQMLTPATHDATLATQGSLVSSTLHLSRLGGSANESSLDTQVVVTVLGIGNVIINVLAPAAAAACSLRDTCPWGCVSGKGTCVEHMCLCAPGWAGKDCSMPSRRLPSGFLINGAFDTLHAADADSDGTSAPVPFWTSTSATGVIRRVADGSLTPGSLRITRLNTTGGSVWAMQSVSMDLENAMPLIVRAYARSAGLVADNALSASAWAQVRVVMITSTNATSTSTFSFRNTASFHWTGISGTITSGSAPIRTLRVYLELARATGTIYFDDVAVLLAPAAACKCDPGYFYQDGPDSTFLGVRAEFFRFTQGHLWDVGRDMSYAFAELDHRVPDTSLVRADINIPALDHATAQLPVTSPLDPFATRLTAYLRITTAGSYTFRVLTSAVSVVQLSLDGVAVCSSADIIEPINATGPCKVTLAGGGAYYDLKLLHSWPVNPTAAAAAYNSRLQLFYRGPDTSNQERSVPSTVLFQVKRECRLCAAGKVCTNGRRWACPGGTYSNRGASVCTPCPSGSLCTGGLQRACPAGTYAIESPPVNSGVWTCAACLSGHSCAGGVMRQCDQGWHADGTTCRPCLPGSYSDQAGATSCDACAEGSTSVVAAEECRGCPSGEFASGEGEATCASCAAGSFSQGGASNCTLCPQGMYSTTAGRSECSSCPPGASTAEDGASTAELCVAEV
eukprot:jgi/Mesvir1/12625/Mv09322-RA.1